MTVLKVLGMLALTLVALALMVRAMAKNLHGLFQLLTGRVPMYRIVRFVLIIGVGFAILYPTLLHFERKSALHLVIKPAAESRVRASTVAEGLLGDQISFGSEKSFEYNIGSQTGSGEFSCSVRGSKGKGDLDVTAKRRTACGTSTRLPWS